MPKEVNCFSEWTVLKGFDRFLVPQPYDTSILTYKAFVIMRLDGSVRSDPLNGRHLTPGLIITCLCFVPGTPRGDGGPRRCL